ncbi:MAG: vWA domain-containing protein [Granulosicoccaceae bacterium]
MPLLEFHLPLLLLLLPLALLPLISGKRDEIPFPWIDWLPADIGGQRLHRLWLGLAALTIALLVIALAGPKSSERLSERIGRGAEISILLDRSASMDGEVKRPILRDYQSIQVQETKNGLARQALSWLLSQRPENRYALTLFSVVPMRIADFTDDTGFLQAGLDASGIGRGPKETNMGLALLAAIEAFDQRPYTGSRAVLLVSDGGAKLDEETRKRIQEGMQRNQISLYFVYVQSGINTPNFDLVGTDTAVNTEEVELHLFFKNLGTKYQVFQADDVGSMGEAVAAIDSQENLPITYYEKNAGIDYSRVLFILALISCAALAMIAAVRMEALK